MSTYKIGVLQQALDESVLATELEAANKQYNELTAKYRDVIQRENSLVARSAIVDNLEVWSASSNLLSVKPAFSCLAGSFQSCQSFDLSE